MIKGKAALPSQVAQAAVNQMLAGQPLTADQIKAVQSMIGNNAVSPQMQAALAKGLQTDSQIKRQIAQNTATTLLAGLSGSGGLGGLGGGLGGSGGNGGGLGGSGGNSGGSGGGGSDGGSGGSGDGYPSSGGDSTPIGSVVDATPTSVGDTGSEQTTPVAADNDGVLIQAVRENAAADLAGLRAGDVILSFGGVRHADLRGTSKRGTAGRRRGEGCLHQWREP